MPKWIGERRLLVGYHEWAWSIRTSGFSVLALFPDGSTVCIGDTQKAPRVYEVPEGALAVVRFYCSNRGYRSYYVVPVGQHTEYVVGERDNFSAPEGLSPEVVRALKLAGIVW